MMGSASRGGPRLERKWRLLCSFCRRREDDVAKLVAGPRLLGVGPRVHICDRCVAVAHQIMEPSIAG